MLSLLVKSFAVVRPMESCRMISTTVINTAARKGTREKARKKKVKVEVKKVGFIPHNQREQSKLNIKRQNKHIDDSNNVVSTDNVWIGKYYRWKVYSIAEAIQCHRETHHPTMFDIPNAPLNALIELYMQGEKKTRFVENFQRTAFIPHKFDHGEERTVLVFAKGQEIVAEAQKAGATMAGGPELIKDIQNGKLQLADYHYVLAHPNMLTELVVLRGLMRKKFPNPKSGTLGSEISEMVHRFLNGIKYQAFKDDYQQDFGLIETSIGTLDMETKHLEENLEYLIKDVDSARPRRDGKFITRVLLRSPPSKEKFKIDPFVFVKENFVKAKGKNVAEAVDDEGDDEEEVQDKKEAAN